MTKLVTKLATKLISKKKLKPVKAREPYAKPTKVHQSAKDKASRKRVKTVKESLLDMQPPVTIVLDVETAKLLANLLIVETEKRLRLDQFLGGGVNRTLREIKDELIKEIQRSDDYS